MSCEPFLDVYDESPLVAESSFRGAAPDRSPPPALEAVRHLLPEPVWAGHPHHIAAYWKAWTLAFGNLQRAHRANGFIAPYVDTAFNDCLFAWDSVFILEFCRYGRRAFDFQRTLDNLYCKQHSDGFISREVRSWTGRDQFHRHDPASTGPNVFAFSEWSHYRETGDRGRLARVLPVLLAYHGWLRTWRTNADGSYYSCGLACGMDNQPRTLPGASAWTHHSWQAWVDATAQALLSARALVRTHTCDAAAGRAKPHGARCMLLCRTGAPAVPAAHCLAAQLQMLPSVRALHAVARRLPAAPACWRLRMPRRAQSSLRPAASHPLALPHPLSSLPSHRKPPT